MEKEEEEGSVCVGGMSLNSLRLTELIRHSAWCFLPNIKNKTTKLLLALQLMTSMAAVWDGWIRGGPRAGGTIVTGKSNMYAACQGRRHRDTLHLHRGAY